MGKDEAVRSGIWSVDRELLLPVRGTAGANIVQLPCNHERKALL
jgi:hypothetical protein